MKHLPVLLRVLVVLLWIHVAVLLGGFVVEIAAAGSPRWSRFGTALIYASGLYALHRRQRSGIDTVLLAMALPPLLLLFAWLREPAALQKVEPWVWWTMAATLIPAAGYLLYCRRTIPWDELDDDPDDEHEPGSYGHWLTHPDERRRIGAHLDEVEQLLKADEADPPDPAALIDDLVAGDTWLPKRRLAQLGDRAVPALVAALGDGRVRPPAADADGECAYLVVLELLPSPAPVEVAPHLLRFADHADAEIRGRTLEVLASTCSDAAEDRIVAGLSDAEEDVRDATAEGLAAAFGAGRGSPELRGRIRATLVDQVRAGSLAATDALIALDPDLARETLADPPYLQVGNGDALYVLRRALERGLELPADRLRALWDDAQARADVDWSWVLHEHVALSGDELLAALDRFEGMDGYAAQRLVTGILDRLVATAHPAAAATVHRLADADLPEVSPHAAGLQNRLAGLPASPDVYGELERQGFDLARLAPPLQEYYVAGFTLSLIGNGGIVHAVECLEDDAWRVLTRVLENAPTEVRDVLQRAFDALAPDGLPVVREDRIGCIAARYDAVHEVLDALSSEFYGVQHRLEVQRMRLVAAHPEAFAGLNED